MNSHISRENAALLLEISYDNLMFSEDFKLLYIDSPCPSSGLPLLNCSKLNQLFSCNVSLGENYLGLLFFSLTSDIHCECFLGKSKVAL